MYKAHVQVVESVRTRGEKRTKLTYKAHEQDISTTRTYKVCTAKNATDLLQVVNFTDLFQLVNKLQQTCQFYQVATSLLKSGLLQLVICILLTTLSCTCKSVENFQKTIHVSCVQELRVLITDIER